MTKIPWKAILQELSTDGLYKLVDTYEVKPPTLKRVKRHTVQQARPVFISHMVKTGVPDLMLQDAAEFYEENELAYREMTKGELHEILHQEEVTQLDLLLYLYSSEDEAHHALAEALLSAEAEERPSEEKPAEDPVVFLREKLSEMEMQLADERVRRERTQEELAALKVKRREQKTAARKKIKDLDEKVVRYAGELHQAKIDKEELEKTNERLRQALEELKAEMGEQETYALSLAGELEAAREQLLRSKKRQVAILGDPNNRRILESERYHFTVFEKDDIKELFNSAEALRFHEFWHLSYKVPESLIHRVGGATFTIQPIATFRELKQKTEQGADHHVCE